jgi:hypothetical protein
MNRLFDTFRLTRSEQRIVIILVLALLALALLTKTRQANNVPTRPESATTATPAAQDQD